MSDIFREVDEEVRRDKAEEYFKKYQTHIIIVAALIVAATAGYRFWDYQWVKAEQAAGAQFEQALQLENDGKSAEAGAALAAIAANAPSGYKILARLAQAAALSKSDPDGAIAAYDALARDSSIGPLFQDAARLRASLLRMDSGEIDKAKSTLEALAAPGGAFRHTAREMLGAIALGAGDFEAAGKWLDMVTTDSDTPATVRANAQALLGVVASGKPATK
jgi:hypothetical protein